MLLARDREIRIRGNVLRGHLDVPLMMPIPRAIQNPKPGRGKIPAGIHAERNLALRQAVLGHEHQYLTEGFAKELLKGMKIYRIELDSYAHVS
jgi:hypothetical protein